MGKNVELQGAQVKKMWLFTTFIRNVHKASNQIQGLEP